MLNGTATLAPLLGLLGTVIGMIQSFDALGGRVGPAKGEALAQGISLALVATAFGLAIAIVSVAAYYYLLNRVDLLVRELDEHARQVIDLVSGEAIRPTPGDRRPTVGAAQRPSDPPRDPRPRLRSRIAEPVVGQRQPAQRHREDRAPMLSDRHQADELPHINMTPMVDVVLCLLVFFMAATRLYDWEENEFAVSVPEVAEAGPLTAAPDDLILTIVKPGKVAVGDDDLRPRRRSGRSCRRPATPTPIRASSSAATPRLNYQDLADVLSVCDAAGIRNVRLPVRPRDGTPATARSACA